MYSVSGGTLLIHCTYNRLTVTDRQPLAIQHSAIRRANALNFITVTVKLLL